jgi:transcriptional regulator with XRE-family HTH domain
MAKRLAQSDWTAQDLQSKREALGMSKAEMARRVGVSYRQYMYYERGQTKISKGLESFVEDLLNPKGNDNNKSQGTLSDFEKDRITRLLNALQNHPLDDLDDKTQKILRQTSEEIVLLLSKLSN